MRTGFIAVFMVLCLLPGCADYTGGLCIPHVDTICYQNRTYWVDSCLRTENVLEECECGCRADSTGCRVCGEKECETDADCPQGYFCDPADWLCKRPGCEPECAGKCCGPDGCGGSCPTNCPGDQECNPVSCMCENHCYTDADCTIDRCCHQGLCVRMDCGDRECGPDPVCGRECGPCLPGYHCDMGACVQPGDCRNDRDCNPDQCCINRQCFDMACGNLECGPDPLCGKECGPCPPWENCVNGVCGSVVTEDPCPPGQECIDITGAGYLGCIIPPATVPIDNQTDCASGDYCLGNFSCHCMNQTCSDSVCIENCGTCPPGLVCYELWADGLWGCLTPDWQLPPDTPYCDAHTPCPGNAICYSDGTDNFCLDNCSAYGGPCIEGEVMCQGDLLLVCQNGSWMEAVDCTDYNQVCHDGACVHPAELGEFCDDELPCADGLDCLGTAQSAHFFCTGRCDCNNLTGCQAGWQCLIGDGDPPTTCWCIKLCTTAADCPDGGAGGYSCILMANDGTNDIYGCMIN